MVQFRWRDAWSVGEKHGALQEEFCNSEGRLPPRIQKIEVSYFDGQGRFNGVNGILLYISPRFVDGRTSPYIVVNGERKRYEHHLRNRKIPIEPVEILVSQIRDFKGVYTEEH